MSHFTVIKVQIKQGEVLQAVLQELGHTVECNTHVRGYAGTRTHADYVVDWPRRVRYSRVWHAPQSSAGCGLAR